MKELTIFTINYRLDITGLNALNKQELIYKRAFKQRFKSLFMLNT